MKMDFERKTFDLQINESYDKICGEILLTTFRRIAIKCTQCDLKYRNVQGFLSHLYAQHLFTEDSSRVILNRSMYGRNNEKQFEADTKLHNENDVEAVNNEGSSKQEEVLSEESIQSLEMCTGNGINESCIKQEETTITKDKDIKDVKEFQHQKKHIGKVKKHLASDPNEENDSKRKKGETDIRIEDITNVANKLLIQEKCIREVKRSNSQRRFTISAEERKHKCPICGLGFREKSNMKHHFRRHSNKKDHQCSECEKKFFTSREVHEHMRVHTGERRFLCSECGSTFKGQSELLIHLKRHANQRDFKCSVCSKAFYTSGALRHHMKGHSSERPFGCHLCPVSFSRQQSLKNHIKLHENKREYKCKLCDAEFNQKAGLFSHMKTNHKVL